MALTLAQEEAERAHHTYIGTEHLLLGVLREGDGRAAAILNGFGVEIDGVRRMIASVLGRNAPMRRVQGIIPTSRVKVVVELSFEEARRRGDGEVGTEHLLLGLLIEREGLAAHVLTELGVTVDKVRDRLPTTPSSRHLAATGKDVERGPSTDVLRELVAAAEDDRRAGLVRELVTNAVALADQRGEELSSEHFLLALTSQGSTTAAEILSKHGLSKATIEALLDDRPPSAPPRGDK